MEAWKTMLRVGPHTAQILVTDRFGNDVLKASLPARPQHPRALLTMLEWLALWSGTPLVVAACVPASCQRTLASTLFGDDLLPVDSALVRFDFVTPQRRRPRRIAGVGDFRQLRLMIRAGGL